MRLESEERGDWSRNVFVIGLPLLGTAVLFCTDEWLNGDIRKLSSGLFAVCSGVCAVATLFCPRLFRRFVVGCLVSPIPYVGFSLLVYAWWILDRDYGIGPEIGQMTGFLIVAVLFLLAVLIPFVFGLSLILGKRNGRGP
ncbi:MAG: hypothetical protein CMO55_16555 [Verrucomicrobiales bacterium]|nr:hypothetical protein [Verrucomicrobiales bacterium]